LRDAAAAAGILYGSDSDSDIAREPPEYGRLFQQQCRLYACSISWKRMMPQPGLAQPAWQDPNIAFARRHQLRLTGGHLLWHENDPDWLKTLSGRDQVESAVRDHIAFAGSRYGSYCYSWNVVNEAINPQEGRPDGLRHTFYLQQMGPGFFDYAFRAAETVAPGVLRVYNDYGYEMDTPEHEAKRTALLHLLDQWIAQGTPINAVGIQSHLRLDGTPFHENKFRGFLGEIAARGLKILLTELDVFDLKTLPDIASRDSAVADLYARYLNAALDEPAVKAVITWGLSDRYSWANDPYFSNLFSRTDHLAARPLPFDGDFQPKPAFYAMESAFRQAPARMS
jgi:endo-1,4-beta-xylanase